MQILSKDHGTWDAMVWNQDSWRDGVKGRWLEECDDTNGKQKVLQDWRLINYCPTCNDDNLPLVIGTWMFIFWKILSIQK
jgi:hypothetical protein